MVLVWDDLRHPEERKNETIDERIHCSLSHLIYLPDDRTGKSLPASSSWKASIFIASPSSPHSSSPSIITGTKQYLTDGRNNRIFGTCLCGKSLIFSVMMAPPKSGRRNIQSRSFLGCAQCRSRHLKVRSPSNLSVSGI